MSRSSKKGPWVEERLMARIDKQNTDNTKQMVKTWSRASTIFPEMVGHTIAVHDGAQARARLRERVDGRSQARRVRAHAHLPRSRRHREAPLMAADDPKPDETAVPDAPAADVERTPDSDTDVVAATDAVETADASETTVPDAPAADVEKPSSTDEDVVEATDAVDAAPEPDAPAATPAKPKPAARKRDQKAPAAKIVRDKHGRPVVDGPVVQAKAKYVRTSARKARLVCDHIRGKSVDDAVAILAHTPRAVAEDWEKLLKSAVANAEHNHELLGDDLKILAVFADEGPTLKRFRPRAMGRATPIRKRTSHLTIQLTPKEQ